MFISKKRPIVIPQHEHGRMAGQLASLWGNDRFDKPKLHFFAFVKGVTLHDWSYGLVDNYPIGGIPEGEWLSVIRKGVLYRFDHPVTDIIVKLHIRRLLGFKDSAPRRDMIKKVNEIIAVRLPESGYTMDDFMWADRITNLCDFIAFYFSFETPIENSYEVYSSRCSNDHVKIQVEINPEGKIYVNPWPFCMDSYMGYIFGYKLEGYPERLDPVMMPYYLLQK